MLFFSQGTNSHMINSDGAFFSASFDKIKREDLTTQWKSNSFEE
jgi:hypothetical protein